MKKNICTWFDEAHPSVFVVSGLIADAEAAVEGDPPLATAAASSGGDEPLPDAAPRITY